MSSVLRETGELARFSGRTILWLPSSAGFASETLGNAARVIRGTLPVTILLNMCLGASIVNFAFFFLRGIGASDYTGVASGFATVYVCAPIMFGYVFTAKVCCGMAADLAAMQVQEEIDAIEAMGVDHIRFVVGTRVLAALIWTPIGTAIGLLTMTLGSYLDATVILKGMSAPQFFGPHWEVQTLGNQLYVLALNGTVAVVGSVVACFYGLRTRGGPAEVGRSVAQACMVNLVLVHVIVGLLAAMVYGTNLTLPIGG
jgi:phospholipid/cholesterol/gamma-HCH transport system permease protein